MHFSFMVIIMFDWFLIVFITVAAGSSGVTSQTAKRILEALENMSSPLIVSVSVDNI